MSAKFPDRTIPTIKKTEQALEERMEAARIGTEQKVNALMGRIDDMQESLDSLWRMHRNMLLTTHKKKPKKK